MQYFIRALLFLVVTGFTAFACKQKMEKGSFTQNQKSQNSKAASITTPTGNYLYIAEYRTTATGETYNFSDPTQNKFELVDLARIPYQVRPDQKQFLTTDRLQLKKAMLDFIELNDAFLAGINSSGKLFEVQTKNIFPKGEYGYALILKTEASSKNVLPWLVIGKNIEEFLYQLPLLGQQLKQDQMAILAAGQIRIGTNQQIYSITNQSFFTLPEIGNETTLSMLAEYFNFTYEPDAPKSLGLGGLVDLLKPFGKSDDVAANAQKRIAEREARGYDPETGKFADELAAEEQLWAARAALRQQGRIQDAAKNTADVADRVNETSAVVGKEIKLQNETTKKNIDAMFDDKLSITDRKAAYKAIKKERETILRHRSPLKDPSKPIYNPVTFEKVQSSDNEILERMQKAMDHYKGRKAEGKGPGSEPTKINKFKDKCGKVLTKHAEDVAEKVVEGILFIADIACVFSG